MCLTSEAVLSEMAPLMLAWLGERRVLEDVDQQVVHFDLVLAQPQEVLEVAHRVELRDAVERLGGEDLVAVHLDQHQFRGDHAQRVYVVLVRVHGEGDAAALEPEVGE